MFQKNLKNHYQKNYYLKNGQYCVNTCGTTSQINQQLSLYIVDSIYSYNCNYNGQTCVGHICFSFPYSYTNTCWTAGGPVLLQVDYTKSIVLPGGSGTRNPACGPTSSGICPS